MDKLSIDWQKEIEAKFQEIDNLYKKYQTEANLLPEDLKTKRQNEIQSFLKKEVPQFFAVLEKSKCLFEFAVEDSYEVALGAASMMLQKLFTVPDITEIDSRTRFDWEYLFSIAKGKK